MATTRFLAALLMLTIGTHAAGLRSGHEQAQGAEPEKPSAQGRLQGRFTAADTGKPIAGAKVRVLIEAVNGKSKVEEPVSDKEGCYVLEVPLGHLRLFGVHGSAGYYTQDSQTYDYVATTAAKPELVRDFVLQPGAAWGVEVRGAELVPEMPPYFSAYPEPDPASEKQWFANGEIMSVAGDPRGKAVLTVPSAGRYRFACGLSRSYEIPAAHVEMEKDFDPRRIKGMPEPVAERKGAVRLRDAAGRTAVVDGTVDGVEVVVEAGQAVLRFPATKVPAGEAFTLRGTAEDDGGKPVEGVRFTVALRIGRGAAMTELQATTGADGKFELKDVLLPLSSFQPDSKVQMMAVKSGFEGAQTKELDLLEIKQAGSGDFGTVVLKPGHTLRGKVVDGKGQPVQGAVIGNHTNYFLYSHLACRTDTKGQFTMPDLPYGTHSLTARCGDQSGSNSLVFDEASGELTLTIHPNPKLPPAGPAPVPKR